MDGQLDFEPKTIKKLLRDNRRSKFWRDKRDRSCSFMCPVCKIMRKLPYQPRPMTLERLAQVTLTAAFFTLVTWSFWQWKGMVTFFPIWVAYEINYRMRFRAAVVCENCGFDPFLFMVDVGKAKKEIDRHWRSKFAEKGIPYPEKPKAPEDMPVNGVPLS